MSYSFNIPFNVERGESMKVIKAIVCANAIAIRDWLEGLNLGSCVVVRKNFIDKPGRYFLYCWMKDGKVYPNRDDGAKLSGGYRTGNTVAETVETFGWRSDYSCKTDAGDEYCVIPFAT